MYDEKNRTKHLYDLLKLVRLPLISPSYLIDVIGKERLIKTDLKARDILDEAKHYHLMPDRRSNFKTFCLRPRCSNDQSGLIYAIGGVNSTGIFFIDTLIYA